MRVGLDVGSTTIKCVVLDDRNNLIYHTYERHYSHTPIKFFTLFHTLIVFAYSIRLGTFF